MVRIVLAAFSFTAVKVSFSGQCYKFRNMMTEQEAFENGTMRVVSLSLARESFRPVGCDL